MNHTDLSDEEIHLLYDLLIHRGQATISAPKATQGLDRLEKVGFVEHRRAADLAIYTLTPSGADALKARKSGLPMPKRDEWPETFLCICTHGTQRWHDPQPHYSCDHDPCLAEFSLTANGEKLHWMRNGESRRLLSHAEAWIRGGTDAKPIRLR